MKAGDMKSKEAIFEVNTLLRGQSPPECRSAGKSTSQHVLINLISVILYMLDVATDLILVSSYFRQDEYLWAGGTLSILVLSALVVQTVSVTWYLADGRPVDCCCSLLHLFLLQPLERFIIVLGFAVTSKGKKQSIELYHRQNEAVVLRLFGVFLQSTSQMILQVHVMLKTHLVPWWTVTSVSISVSAFLWAIAVYYYTVYTVNRHSSKPYTSILVLILAVTGLASARILTLSLFATVFSFWTLLLVCIHWLVMFIWLMIQKTDWYQSRHEKIIVTCVISLIYCLTLFNLRDHTSFWLFAYHILMFCENIMCLGVWYHYSTCDWYNLLLFCAVCSLHLLGIFFTVMFCHLHDKYLAISVTGNEQDTQQDSGHQSVSSNYQIHSTPAKPGLQCEHSKRVLKNNKSSFASTLNFARRALLKNRASKLDIEFKSVATPSQLSPIKATPSGGGYKNIYTDCTAIQLQDTSAFHHFSVDASVCFHVSRCKTLEGTDISLSAETDDNLVKESASNVSKPLVNGKTHRELPSDISDKSFTSS